MLAKPLKNNSGTAIITALFIMTLVAIAATAMSLRMQIEIRRTQLTVNADKAYFAAQAVEYWALDTLMLAPPEKNNKKARIDNIPQLFPDKLFPYPGTQISGRLDDLQGLFNINTLTSPKAIPGFTQLLLYAMPKMKRQQAITIAKDVHQWLAPYAPGKGQTALDSYYLKVKPPYYPAHRMMTSSSEFRLIRGVNALIYQTVVPYLSALPAKKTAININTAPLPVLRTLGAGLSEAQAKTIITARKRKPFDSTEDFKKRMSEAKMEIPVKNITVISDYFLATAIVKLGRQRLIIYNQLKRSISKKKVEVTVLRQSLNSP